MVRYWNMWIARTWNNSFCDLFLSNNSGT